ncbi:MAG: hypothetical protein DSZ00_10280 [Gammaproteobacteria bacterium]|nr:MAG: hypothetical protein DSZ00_10280 [Gammaproteobacteria bacterium]RTZ73992.1 MAG: hypothetical protein DSZ02_06100 [Gammaproteobacteria bacterium]RTZ80406.1 MAG: hypothetical protein DSZ01_02245 [Gammaproteobacteria bacterium]
MDLTSIELPGSVIQGVTRSHGEIRIRFEPAYLIQTMTGSEERTRWRQNIVLIFEDAELLEGESLELPATCAGGDVTENVYTYRDMVPVPLESRGRAGCDLTLEGSDARLRVEAGGVRLEREDLPRYIEHIRKS